MITAW